VKVHHVRLVGLRHEVNLVNDEACRNVASGCRDEQAVEETRVQGGEPDGLHAPDAVDVRDEDVLLAFSRSRRPPTELVGPIVNLCDEAGVILLGHSDRDSIPHGHWIGHVLLCETEFPPKPRGNGPVPDLNVVPAPGRARDNPVEMSGVRIDRR
jgi:hypothetical protein